jgi:hypothetical protein
MAVHGNSRYRSRYTMNDHQNALIPLNARIFEKSLKISASVFDKQISRVLTTLEKYQGSFQSF